MPRLRALLFDFHETLISADRWMAFETGGLATAIPQRLGVVGTPPSPEEQGRIERAYARVRAVSAGAGVEYSAAAVGRAVLRALGRGSEADAAAVDTVVDRLFHEHLSDVTVKPGAPDALVALADRGCRMGIVSNAAHGPFLRWALAAHGLDRHFASVIVSADLGMRKPRREIFDAALRALDVRADEAAYVGNDYVKDVMGAKLAGLRAVWMPDAGAEDYRADTDVQPDAVVDGFGALVPVVSAWIEGRNAAC
jgi:HAD superfamily hydrolase (TIGR01509 family)